MSPAPVISLAEARAARTPGVPAGTIAARRSSRMNLYLTPEGFIEIRKGAPDAPGALLIYAALTPSEAGRVVRLFPEAPAAPPDTRGRPRRGVFEALKLRGPDGRLSGRDHAWLASLYSVRVRDALVLDDAGEGPDRSEGEG